MARDDTNDPEIKSELRWLDGVLPEGLNRRNFLKGAVTSSVVALAGCSNDGGSGSSGGSSGSSGGSSGSSGGSSGSSDGSSGTTSGDDFIQKGGVIWRDAWKAEPAYTASHAAAAKGIWADLDITPPVAKSGFGSSDTAKRVGTNVEPMGMGDITGQMAGLAEGYDLSIIGMARERGTQCLYWNRDAIGSNPMGDAIADQTCVTVSGNLELSWPYIKKQIDAPSSLKFQPSKETAAFSLFEKGDVNLLWEHVNDIPSVQANADFDLGVLPIWNYKQLLGYSMIVNNEWLKNTSKGVEYTARVTTGYSRAQKWVMLNPEKAVNFMKTDVNQALQTEGQEELLGAVKTGVAIANTTDNQKENGVCHPNADSVESTRKFWGSNLEGASTSDIPPTDELMAKEVIDAAEYTELTKDEWSQIGEFAGKYNEVYTGDPLEVVFKPA